MAKKTKKLAVTKSTVDEKPAAPLKDTPEIKQARIPTLKYLAYGVPTSIIVIFTIVWLSFVFLAHHSFAALYAGSVPINADDSYQLIEEKVSTAFKNYRLTFEFADGQKKSYPAGKAGISIDAAASAASARKIVDGSFLQRLEWWRPLKIPLTIKTNNIILKSFITRYITLATKPVKNASLSIKNGKVIVSPEQAGYGSHINQPEIAIINATANLSVAPLKLRPSKIEPSIYSTDLKTSEAKIEAILSQKVTLNIAGQTTTASPTDIGNWLDLAQVPVAKTVDVSVNSGKVLAYINNVALPYIQPPRDRLVIKQGDSYKVIDNGADGLDVLNKDKTAADIAKHLLEDKGMNVDLTVSYASAQTVDVKAYPKWILVNTTTKRMYAYEQTKLVRTFLISAGAPLTPTVLGQYKIYAKFKSQDMRGLNVDGSRYFQPAVPYVNYFYGDYAIHGNYWRPLSYFGNINSSHGCVGVVTADAAWIYNWAPIGTTLVIHN